MAPDPFESNTATLDEEPITNTEPVTDTRELEPATSDSTPVPEEVAGDESNNALPPASSILIRKSEVPAQTIEPQHSEPVVRRSIMLRLASMLLWPIVGILTLIDVPFAGLSAGLKSILGLVAMATSVIAAATWTAVFMFPHH